MHTKDTYHSKTLLVVVSQCSSGQGLRKISQGYITSSALHSVARLRSSPLRLRGVMVLYLDMCLEQAGQGHHDLETRTAFVDVRDPSHGFSRASPSQVSTSSKRG